ncbi:hypothetical protein R0131_08765 [Clostridium sp. AL.422]|uniref:hypothetical protein n=1 Tax=Clostridium TaxID=1485 RepID=UPI00293DA536|nr:MULTISPECIES: hypothetical protein [unclassified Clostridium]MDV4150926.1 hypothetical protein [Clostridium sp. AL.422]
MSKRKRRRREERVSNQASNNLGNNMPFGINPNQLMNLLGGNVDLNQIGNMLSAMKNDGIDLNNFNLNQGSNNQSNPMGFDFGPLQGMMNNMGFGGFNIPNNNSGTSSFENNNTHIEKLDNDDNDNQEIKEDETEEFLEEDENIQMLIAIKSIVDPKKAIFLEKVIDAYNKGHFK